MNKSTLLVIPSRNRAGWLYDSKHHTLKTVNHLKPEFWIRNDDQQLNMYRAYYREYSLNDNAMQNLKIYNGHNILGAAQTYDLIIDITIKRGYKYLMILDDDLTLSMRNPIKYAKPDYRKCTKDEMNFLLAEAVKLVSKEVPMMSFTPIMTRTQPHIIQFCKPMMMAYIYYLPHFKEHPEHRFWKGKEIEARCDLNLTLNLLTQGYLTAFNTTLFIPDNVNNPGGCSTYRDINFERESVFYLKGRFPEFVRLHKKKGWIDDPDVIRMAPIISWKKAFNKEAFYKNFGIDANKFAFEQITNFEKVYSTFIRSIRDADANNKG